MTATKRVRPALLLDAVSDEREYGRGKKSFNAALTDVTLLLKPGESVGILGRRRDGTGLLSEIISGMRHPAEGRTFIDGDPLVLDEAGSFLTQETLQFNMERFAMAHQMSGQRLRAAIEIVATEAGVDASALGEDAASIDHEVLERIRFYLALATGTKILVVEEAELLFDLLQQEPEQKKVETFRRRGGALIVISQDPRNLNGITDRTCWLHDGRIIMDDETAAVARWHKQLKAAERAKERGRAGQLLRRFQRQYEPPVLSIRGRSGSRAI